MASRARSALRLAAVFGDAPLRLGCEPQLFAEEATMTETMMSFCSLLEKPEPEARDPPHLFYRIGKAVVRAFVNTAYTLCLIAHVAPSNP
jgi:hypothetical protein